MTERQWKELLASKPRPINHKELWYREHQAREMINSYLAYQCKGYKVARDVLNYDDEHNRRYHYLDDYIADLGEAKVLELIQEQIDDIECVIEDCFVDNEYVHYNCIVWKDDDEETRRRKGVK